MNAGDDSYDGRRDVVFYRRVFLGSPTAGLGIPFGPDAATAQKTTSTVPVTVIDTKLKVNGTEHHLRLDWRVTLLDALREHLNLTGVKKGCDRGQCDACTVIVNGRR